MASRTIPTDTAAEVRRRIHIRFGRTTSAVPVPEHLVFNEVSMRESPHKSRRIDVVAVGMLRRTEHLIHGFEIKVSRGDLLSEFREPGKSWAQRYCDRWWLALSTPELLRDDDPLPGHWGVIACHGRGLRIHRDAAPIDRLDSGEFRAALLHAGQRAPGYRRAMGFQAGVQRANDAAAVRIKAALERGRFYGRLEAQQQAATEVSG